MAKKKSDGSGLMSSAGLMRYFEADDTAIKLNPKTLIAFSSGVGAAVLVMNYTFGLWP